MTEAPFPTTELAGWADEWRRTRALTYDLLRLLPYAVMNFSPHPEFGTFARQIRHVGDIQTCYLIAVQSGTMDFSAQLRRREMEQSKEHLEAYLRELDAELISTLAALDRARLDRPIQWGDEQVSLLQHLRRLLQHETLHHGMWTMYARIADLPLPQSWQNTWALRFQ